jgi:hypothetical protein
MGGTAGARARPASAPAGDGVPVFVFRALSRFRLGNEERSRAARPAKSSAVRTRPARVEFWQKSGLAPRRRRGYQPPGMKVLVTGAAGFIGYHVARRLAETKRCEVLGIDSLNDYYDPALKRARLAAKNGGAANEGLRDLSFPAGGFCRRGEIRGAGGAFQTGLRRPPRGAAGGALQHGAAGGVHARQPGGVCQRARSLPPHAAEAPRVCLQQQRLRGGGEAAVPRGRQHRPARLVLRRDQEGQRGHGAQLRAQLRAQPDRPALLHRVRAVGPAGHGADALCPRDFEGRKLQLFNAGRGQAAAW